MVTYEQAEEMLRKGIELGKRASFKSCETEPDGDDILIYSTLYVSSVEKYAWTGEVIHMQRIKPDGSIEDVKR
jgi:hypothetical protein